MAQVSQTYIYTLMVCMIIFGGLNTIIFKGQDKMYVNGQDFNHPFMQTMIMFCAEFSCFIFYYYIVAQDREGYRQRLAEAKQKGLDTNYNPFWLAIPASCDFLTTTFQFFGLSMIDASVYQMLRGGVIIITAIFSVLFLKKKLYRHHYLGITLAIIGITIVGTVAISGGSSSKSSNASLGVLLILCSLVFNGALFVGEELIFTKYYYEPMQVVGTEGLFGTLLCCIFVPIFSNVTLPDSYDGGIIFNGVKYVENADVFFDQVGSDGTLQLLIVTGMFTMAFYNFFGVQITRNVSSLARSVLDVTRTVLVWVFGLFMVNSDRNGGGHWEKFNIFQVIGFIVLVIGNFIYNEIIVLQYFDLDKYVKNKKQEALLDDSD